MQKLKNLQKLKIFRKNHFSTKTNSKKIMKSKITLHSNLDENMEPEFDAFKIMTGPLHPNVEKHAIESIIDDTQKKEMKEKINKENKIKK
jgi:hypothetical protein